MNGPSITDHALVRYVERTGMFGIEAIRDELARKIDRAHKAATLLGKTEYLVSIDGLSFLIKDGSIVTVVDKPSIAWKARALKFDEYCTSASSSEK